MDIPEYKYDFDLSSKKKFFLYMYQKIPNIDIIIHIYKLKEELEDEDIRVDYGLLPPIIEINDSKLQETFNPMKLNTMLIKLIIDKGFICSFTYCKDDYHVIEINEINNGNWFSVISNINTNPPLKLKLKLMNILYDEVPLLVTDIYDKLNKIYLNYLNNDYNGYFRLGIDQNNKIYIPLLYV